MNVVFRADASTSMGGGHVMRCLALADQVLAGGGRALFVGRPVPRDIERRIVGAGHTFRPIAFKCLPTTPAANWDSQVYDPTIQHMDAASTLAESRSAGMDADWIVVDHYALDRHWEGALRQHARILAIDDLANRAHDIDVLVDQTLDREPEDYRDLVPVGCALIVGSRFALLRTEFLIARPAALARRESRPPVKRVLVTLGMSDADGLGSRALDAIARLDSALDIDMVVGSASASLPELHRIATRHRRVTIHADVDAMAPLMSRADLAIGAAGSTSWERCSLGLPSLTFVIAANQRLIARNLEAAGAHRIAVDPECPTFTAALSDLLRDAEARFEMSRRAAALVDGLGCQRVYAAMQSALPGR